MSASAAGPIKPPPDPAAWYLDFPRYLHRDPAGAPLRSLFPQTDSVREAIERHRHLLTRALINPPMEQAIAQAIGRFTRDRLNVPDRPKTPADAVVADRLNACGWADLLPWSRAEAAALREALTPLPLYAKDGAARSGPLSFEEARAFNVADYAHADLLALPAVRRFVCEPVALAAAERFLEGPPLLITLAAWWSFPEHEARDAQLFHLDIDDHRFVKHFLYLTDVDEESGPHAYVEGTHRPEDYGAMIAAAGGPAEQKEVFDWLFRTLRKSDAEVVRRTGKQPTLITGAAGARFLAATRGLHKGVPPTKRPRLLLQATYGVTPAGAAKTGGLPRTAEAALSAADRHLLWLFLERGR